MRSIHRAFLVTLVLGVGATLAAQQPTPPKSTPPPRVFGTSVINYVKIAGVEFLPFDSDFASYTSDEGSRYSLNCSGQCFVAPLHLPSGAKLVYIELDFTDSRADAWVAGALYKCDYAGQNCLGHPTAGSKRDCAILLGLCSGLAFAGGEGFVPGDLTPDDITVDNFHDTFYLQFGGTSTDGQTRIGGVIVGYVLQVSPAPGTATFTDVPTNHPYFQFIEALFAAGITSGCNVSPPQYCPDRQITRGEMAVYLAKALGLEFQ